jgi:hypothetical protein
MRYAVVAVLGLAIVVAAALYLRADQPPSTVVATPTPTITPSAVPSTPSPTSAASPALSGALGTVTMQVTRTAVPAEFRYLLLGRPEEFRLVVLDLDAGKSMHVATARVAIPLGTPVVGTMSTSTDGRSVLVTFVLPEAADSVFLVRPETGDARLVLRAEVRGAVISSDGARVAIGRNDEDRSLTGLWVGSVGDGAMRRLVADDPQSNASPPLPYAFSPDGAVLAFGLGLGESGRRAMVVPIGSTEGRVDRSSGDSRIIGGDAVAVGPAEGAEFRSARELFVWSSRSLFGGVTVAYLYDLTTKRTTELYRPTGDARIAVAAWRPNAEQYAMIDVPLCCGAFVADRAAWLRGRDGSVRKLGEAVVVVDMWWSRDGSRLFAQGGADDSNGRVTDLLTGTVVMQFCLRGGGPPPAACV